MTVIKAAFCLAAALALSGCAGVTKADLAPRSDPLARLAPADPSPWRQDLGDPVLAALLQRADLGALDVKIALARAARAQAEVAAAEAARGFTVSAGADAAIGGRSLSDTKRAATPSIDLRYEVDLWGRLRKSRDAAGADAAASAQDVQSARLAIAADASLAYVTLRRAEAERASALLRRDLASRVVGLEQKRVAEGVADGQALASARTAAARTQARVAWLDEERDLQAARLGDLIGERGLVLAAGALPAATAGPAQAPSDVVDARPDVRAALQRLRAADARRAAAVADSRPKFVITALLGAPDATLATLLDTRALAWALAGAITDDLFDSGAKRTRIDAAGADADAADLAYRKVVSTAWAEVRAALTVQARTRRDVEATRSDLADAQVALDTGERRAREGVIDGIGLAKLQDAVEVAAAGDLAARSQLLNGRVQLALATGGQ